jgi:cellulose synthase operon protein C
MTTSSKPLSPAELSALEHAFASDPGSEAYRPLTEAYLANGRFMEAMVVCKKGVKAHPDDPAAKVLLARVYADQGKDRKALEELSAVLAAFPTFAAANRLAGVLHLRLGERAPGEAALLRAAEAAPDDPEIRAALAKHGITASAPAAAPSAGPPATPAAPPRAPSPDGPPVAPRVAAPAGRRAGPPAGAAPVRAPARPGAPATESAPADRSEEVPLPTPVPSRVQGRAYAEQLAEKYGTQSFQIPGRERAAKGGHRPMIVGTVGLAVALAAALGGWAMYSKARSERIERVAALLKDTTPLIEKDVYPAYVEAAQKAEAILEADPDALAGHAFLAYVSALRAAEHGDGEPARTLALKHVQAGRALGRHSHLIAAEAYLQLHAGDAAGAKETLDAVLGGEGGAQSAFLTAVLGAVHLRAGDLDDARDVLSRAQKQNAGDPRTAWLLAESFRRRGEGYELQASGWYDYALRTQKEHVPSILGKALVLLGRGQLDEPGRAAALVLDPRVGASRPQLALAHAIRGGVLAAQGKPEDAGKEEAEAAKLDPGNADLAWLVGQRKLRAGDAAGAVEAFQRAVALDAKRVSLYADLVRALLAKEGGTPQAIDVLKKAVTRLGESPRLALLLGDAYRAQGDADLARGQYEKAIALGKPFPDARVALARLHRDRNNIPGALVELTQAIDEYGAGGAGGAAVAYVEKADVERARGAKREVLEDLYAKALELDPANCEALWGAGKLEYDLAKLTDKAKLRLEAYARSCPRAAHAAEAGKLVGR